MRRRQTDGNHDAFEVLGHIVIAESEHTVSARGEPFVAAFIVANALFEIVAFAIDLNDQLA